MYYVVLQEVFASSHCSFSAGFISSSGGLMVTRCCRSRSRGSRENARQGPMNCSVGRRKGQFLLPQSLLDKLEQFLPAGLHGHSSISEASESLDSLSALQFGQKPGRPFRQRREPEVQNQRGPDEHRLLIDEQ